ETGADRQGDRHSGSCRCRASRRRTTHVVDPLPERVRLVAAPGDLLGVELEGLGWTTEAGEVGLGCRLVDCTSGAIPAPWPDLPLRVAAARPLGVVASPPALRLLLARGEALRAGRPRPRPAWAENGGGRDGGGAARACDGRAGGGAGGGVGDAAAGGGGA